MYLKFDVRLGTKTLFVLRPDSTSRCGGPRLSTPNVLSSTVPIISTRARQKVPCITSTCISKFLCMTVTYLKLIRSKNERRQKKKITKEGLQLITSVILLNPPIQNSSYPKLHYLTPTSLSNFMPRVAQLGS